jgi:NAD(P)H-dependent flavin oxidoreductase YrpB (nitropropane dioxygenase family)
VNRPSGDLGWEAGGHNYGGLPIMVLVPEILDAVSPALVLASGGIVDGRGVAAALALGADGVWVGTRLVVQLELGMQLMVKPFRLGDAVRRAEGAADGGAGAGRAAPARARGVSRRRFE